MTWLHLIKMSDVKPKLNCKEADGLIQGDQVCPRCQESGKTNKLQLFQINLDEAIVLCTGTGCNYPMGAVPSPSIVLKRDASLAKFSRKRKQKADNSPVKHARMAPPASPVVPKARRLVEKAPEIKVKPVFAQGSIDWNSIGSHSDPSPILESIVADAIFDSNSIVANRQVDIQMKESDTSVQSNDTIIPNIIQQPVEDHIEAALSPIDCSSLLEPGIAEMELKSTTPPFAEGQPEPANDESSDFMVYPQWINKDQLCWLDVVLCLLVHNRHFGTLACNSNIESPIIELIKTYKKACLLYNSQLKPVDEYKINNVMNMNSPKAENKASATALLVRQRQSLWRHLSEKLLCQLGEDESATCALMLLMKTAPLPIQQLCNVKYNLTVSCGKCGHTRSDSLEKRVLIFSDIDKNFSMAAPETKVRCDHCLAKGQKVKWNIPKYPDVLFSHFLHGLPGSTLEQYTFHSPGGRSYRVQGLVQYKRDPDHFIAWIRNNKSGLWMECDDMKDSSCSFKHRDPGFPLGQVHLVMWEGEGSATVDIPVCPIPVCPSLEKPSELIIKREEPLTRARKAQLKVEQLRDALRNNSSTKFTNLKSKDESAGSSSASTGVRNLNAVLEPKTSRRESRAASASSEVSPKSPNLIGRRNSMFATYAKERLAAKSTGSKESSTSPQKPPNRIERMRQRFLKDVDTTGEPISSVSLPQPAKSKVGTMSKKGGASSAKYASPGSDKKLNARAKPENGNGTNSAPNHSLETTSRLSDRIRKFLPNSRSFKIADNLSKPELHLLSPPRRSFGAFSGYVPKCEPNKSDSVKNNDLVESPTEKSSPKSTKNVKFSNNDRTIIINKKNFGADALPNSRSAQPIPSQKGSRKKILIVESDPKVNGKVQFGRLDGQILCSSEKISIPGLNPLRPPGVNHLAQSVSGTPQISPNKNGVSDMTYDLSTPLTQGLAVFTNATAPHGNHNLQNISHIPPHHTTENSSHQIQVPQSNNGIHSSLSQRCAELQQPRVYIPPVTDQIPNSGNTGNYIAVDTNNSLYFNSQSYSYSGSSAVNTHVNTQAIFSPGTTLGTPKNGGISNGIPLPNLQTLCPSSPLGFDALTLTPPLFGHFESTQADLFSLPYEHMMQPNPGMNNYVGFSSPVAQSHLYTPVSPHFFPTSPIKTSLPCPVLRGQD